MQAAGRVMFVSMTSKLAGDFADEMSLSMGGKDASKRSNIAKEAQHSWSVAGKDMALPVDRKDVALVLCVSYSIVKH